MSIGVVFQCHDHTQRVEYASRQLYDLREAWSGVSVLGLPWLRILKCRLSQNTWIRKVVCRCANLLWESQERAGVSSPWWIRTREWRGLCSLARARMRLSWGWIRPCWWTQTKNMRSQTPLRCHNERYLPLYLDPFSYITLWSRHPFAHVLNPCLTSR